MKPVIVKGIHFAPFAMAGDFGGVWIGSTLLNGNWIKTTFDIAGNPNCKYELFTVDDKLYIRERCHNKVNTYLVTDNAIECDIVNNRAKACLIYIDKLKYPSKTQNTTYRPTTTTLSPNTNTKTKDHFDIKSLIAGIVGIIVGLLTLAKKRV